jgi:phosphonate transport system substrate-binding protein
MDQSSAPARQFSLRNVLVITLPLAILAGAAIWYFNEQAERQLQPVKTDQRSFLRYNLVVPTALDEGLVDGDDDLVAAPPKDPAKLIDPETLVFALLSEKEEPHFADFADYLEKRTGKKVKLLAWEERLDSQMDALRNGELHIAALSTGSVSLGVNKGGFIPVCVMADDAGKFGYNMELIVPAASTIKSPKDLKGKNIGFVSSYSHSGFKAPVLILWKEFGLNMGTDYDFTNQGSQETVVENVAKGQLVAGAVANDLLKRMIAAKEIDGNAIRSIYTSETFPTACYGYAHQLKPELAEKVKAAFLEFPWRGSSLEKAFGPAGQTKFVPVTYKDDWATIRRMEQEALKLIEGEPVAAKK